MLGLCGNAIKRKMWNAHALYSTSYYQRIQGIWTNLSLCQGWKPQLNVHDLYALRWPCMRNRHAAGLTAQGEGHKSILAPWSSLGLNFSGGQKDSGNRCCGQVFGQQGQ